MKFWPGDWTGDAALRICGLAARGLWIECIAIMHEATPYGHLMVNGRAITHRQLGSIVGVSERDVGKLLTELEEAGVFSRTAEGVIYSRRMVRDNDRSEEGKSAVAKRWGKKGGGDDPNTPPTPEPKGDPNAPPNRVPCSLEAEAEAETEAEEEPPSPPSVARPPRGSRLPADWVPSATDFTFATGLGLDAGAVAEQFRDFWHAKAGKDAAKCDWPATWRGWCRREVAPSAKRGPPQRESKMAHLIRGMQGDVFQ